MTVTERMRETCEVRIWEEEDMPVPREILEKEIAEADGLYCRISGESGKGYRDLEK